MMMISILCATRERPARFEAMVESAFRTASHPERVTVLARVDRDDPRLSDYETLSGTLQGATFVCGESGSVMGMFNDLAARASGDVLMACADDVLFRTPAWDLAVERALGDGCAAVAVPMDGAEARKGLRCTHFFVTRAWFDCVGHLVHPTYEHFYADTHIADIAMRANRLIWLRDVLVEHMHPNNGKAPRDLTYSAKRVGPKGRRASDRDQERYTALSDERRAVAERIRGGAHG
jgi:glycosyl transferase/beta-hydroxylase protein BlmF